MEEQRPSLVSDVEIRPERIVVAVDGVRTKDGKPLRVLCISPPQREIAEVLRVTGGPRPKPVEDGDEDDGDEDEAESLERFDEIAHALIGRYTALERADGSPQIPGISFAEPLPAGALPGRMLTFADVQRLSTTIMYLGGYLEGPSAGSFSGDEGRGGAGDGTAATGATPAAAGDPALRAATH